MKKLKFAQDQGSLFYQALSQRIDEYFKLNNISKTGDTKMKFKILLYFGLTLFTYLFMLQSKSVTAFFFWYMAMGIAVLLTAFNVSHDAAHGVAVKSKKWNKFLFQLSFQLQGNNAYVWGNNHNNSHHLYTNIEGSDIDVLNNPLVRMNPTQTLKRHHRWQYIYTPFLYLFYSLNWFLFRELLMIFRYSSRTIQIHIPTIEIIKIFLFKLLYIGYMIAIPLIILPFHPGYILLAFLFNHFIVSLIFTAVLAVSHLSDYVQHPAPDNKGKLAMSWPSLQMCTSVDYNIESRFFNWTLGGFNAHALHHLLPNICHIHYPKLVPLFRKTCEEFGITYMELNYTEALKSHFRFLKTMGQQQSPKTKTYENPR